METIQISWQNRASQEATIKMLKSYGFTPLPGQLPAHSTFKGCLVWSDMEFGLHLGGYYYENFHFPSDLAKLSDKLVEIRCQDNH